MDQTGGVLVCADFNWNKCLINTTHSVRKDSQAIQFIDSAETDVTVKTARDKSFFILYDFVPADFC